MRWRTANNHRKRNAPRRALRNGDTIHDSYLEWHADWFGGEYDPEIIRFPDILEGVDQQG